MPEIDVYIDSELASANNWQSFVPTMFEINTSLSGAENVIDAFIIGATLSGANSLQIEAPFDSPGYVGDSNSSTSFSIDSVNNWYRDTNITNEIGITYDELVKITNDLYIAGSTYSWVKDVETEFGVNENTVNKIDDSYMDFQIYIGSAPAKRDTVVDITMSDDVYYWCGLDMFSTVSGIIEYLNVEISTTSGIVYGLYTDLFSAGLKNDNYIPTDIFCSASGTNYIPSDIETALGEVVHSTADIYSTTMSGEKISCDVRTWSMFFGDFFLDVEDFTTASSTAWVDVVDYMWPIDLNESYFLVDGQRVSVTFSGIVGGQRMFYDPSNDFYSEGTLTYTAHFTNSMGDVMERDHYLLYGYDLNFVDLVDWGACRKVEILAYAKNKAFCPNKGSGAFYFVTKDYAAINLMSTIRPFVPSNLGSVVSTQSTAFYYGSTYTVSVSGIKDFAGNYLEPFSYDFTIEDPIN